MQKVVDEVVGVVLSGFWASLPHFIGRRVMDMLGFKLPQVTPEFWIDSGRGLEKIGD